MKKALQSFFALCLMVLMTVACSSSKKAATVDDLKGAWTIVKVNNTDIQGTTTVPFVEFDLNQNIVSGNAACNTFNGNIVLKENDRNTFELGNISATRMACPDMQVENEVFEALRSTRSVKRLDNGNLVLVNGTGLNVLELKKR